MSTYLKNKLAALPPLRAAVAAAAIPEPLFVGAGTSQMGDNRSRWHSGHRSTARAVPPVALYRVTDRLHEGRTVDVPWSEIVGTVSTWFAELGAYSPLVEDLHERYALAIGQQLMPNGLSAVSSLRRGAPPSRDWGLCCPCSGNG